MFDFLTDSNHGRNRDQTESTSSPQVFEGTPLSDYLSDTGMSDWGIDESDKGSRSGSRSKSRSGSESRNRSRSRRKSGKRSSSGSTSDDSENEDETESSITQAPTPTLSDKFTHPLYTDNDFFQGDYQSFDGKNEIKLRKRIINNSSVPFPLLLSPDSPQSQAKLRKQKLISLIKNALKPELNDVENARFLERFRYILITSQLLESTINKNRSGDGDGNGNGNYRLLNRKHNILFGDDGPWNTLKMQKKYWTGGGGCIVVVVTLLTWHLRRSSSCGSNSDSHGVDVGAGAGAGSNSSIGDDHSAAAVAVTTSTTTTTASTTDSTLPSTLSSTTSPTITTSILIVLLTFLFLFSHSRRRVLRLLRSKSIAYASHFVENNHSFDLAITKSLSLIQEIDLLSLGYKPNLINSEFKIPSSRINNYTKHIRTSKSIRSAITSTLYLSITSYLNAIKNSINFCSELDIQKYFDIYQLQSAQQEFGFIMNDDFVGFKGDYNLSKESYYGSNSTNASIKFLKSEFNKLHFLRRAFICCLISISTSGICNKQELDKWGTVVDELESCSGLMMRLADSVSKSSLFPYGDGGVDIMDETEDTSSLYPTPSQQSTINHLANSLQHVQARLHVLSEQDNFEDNYNQLGKDIEQLLSTWKSNHNNAQDSKNKFKKSHLQNASISTSTTLFDLNDNEDSIITSDDSSSETLSPKYGSIRESSRNSSMTILEAIVQNDSKPRSPLTRQARISVMKQQREIEAQKKSVIQQRDNFVLELGDVLHKRGYGIGL